MGDHPESLTNDTELEDLDERDGFDVRRIDLSQLRSPVVVQALAGIAVATAVLVWPERSDRILARLIGLGILVVAVTSAWTALRSRPRHRLDALFGLAGIGLGTAILASPNQSEVVLARIVGATIVATAVRDLVEIRDRRGGDPKSWVLSRSVALLGVGSLLLVFPSEVFAAATTIVALGWIAVSIVVVVIALDPDSSGVSDYPESTRLIASWLHERSKSVDDRQALYDKILYEGPLTRRRLVRFFALMGFASVISSTGVLSDSTAVVIGAMLIAPLMTPLMGMAMSLVMGWPHRLTRSTLVAGGGIGFAIAIGMLVGLVAPGFVDTTTNGQIIARSSPTILDLVTAVAAGAAGAYGLSRPDVSDSLPGVAIAISLVPPLSVVGIAYSQGDWDSGHGALLLFMTNMLAILIMGGITFIATGVTPIRRATENQHRVRTWLATVATLAAIVVGALLLNGAQITANLLEESTAESAVDDWLGDHPAHALVRVDLDGDIVTATIVGPSTGVPTADALAARLDAALGRQVVADVRLIVEERDVATSGG